MIHTWLPNDRSDHEVFLCIFMHRLAQMMSISYFLEGNLKYVLLQDPSLSTDIPRPPREARYVQQCFGLLYFHDDRVVSTQDRVLKYYEIISFLSHRQRISFQVHHYKTPLFTLRYFRHVRGPVWWKQPGEFPRLWVWGLRPSEVSIERRD